MPTVEAPNTNGGNQSQFQDILTTFTSLTDPLAIHSALLVLDHALQGANASEATQQILSSIPLSHFLQLLETDHGNDTELTIDRTCNVIESLLRDQSFSTISQDSLLHDALLQALNAAFPRVHALGLSQVDKIANENISVLKSMVKKTLILVFKMAI
ncbi:hypothetical protein BX616_004329 [Lobosporangium transversale]|nr:hypothetical protein BX616_004329 [Lobosporangium transversale]